MTLRNPHAAELPVLLRHGPAFELLAGLYATGSPGTASSSSWAPDEHEALATIGRESGELWLHLLGLALELGADTAALWIDRVRGVESAELRRHLLGVHVPAWRAVAGVETLERAADGDSEAAGALLENARYYAGRARESLAALLPLGPDETRELVLDALVRYERTAFAPREHDLVAQLAADADARRPYRGYDLVDRAAGGYRYETEPGFERVVLVPHLAARPQLLLCQHETTRIICYPARTHDRTADERMVALGRALGDPKRLALLSRLRESNASLAELAGELGLAKSTTHHHLAQLRAAGLIALAGNASGYHYTLAPEGFADAEALLAGFAGRSL
jgi:DNA-binding transcriptional ArsR family regulator